MNIWDYDKWGFVLEMKFGIILYWCIFLEIWNYRGLVTVTSEKVLYRIGKDQQNFNFQSV